MSADDDETAPTERDGSARPGGPRRWVLVLAGLLVGVVIGGALGWWSSRDGEEAATTRLTPPTGPAETFEAAEAFLEAWERSRRSTYLTGSLLERSTASGTTLELPLVVAQRPPERVVSTGESVEGNVGGQRLLCDEQLDGMVHCLQSDGAGDYEAEVAAELEVLAGYVRGELPLYRVAHQDGCFDLRLARAIHAPPYGHDARFCFDVDSGAPSLQRIERTEATDVVSLVSVRTEVADEDLRRVATGDIDESLLAG